MQIETTVDKAALLRLGYHLGGGGLAEQKVDRTARDSIGQALGAIAGVRLVATGGFALTPASVGEQAVTFALDTDQLARAVHKVRDGQWPALSDAQLDLVEALAADLDGWLKQAHAYEVWARLSPEEQARAKGDK